MNQRNHFFSTFLRILLFTGSILRLQAQRVDLPFKHLTVNENLSQGVNPCIYKDSRGYIWISSYDGLNQYDGTNCIVYRQERGKPGSIKGTLFLNILEDTHHDLWIGSNAGLIRYDRKTGQFQQFINNDKQATTPDVYSPFYIDHQNQIWVQGGNQILKFNPDNRTFHLIYQFSNPAMILRAAENLPYQPLTKIVAAIKNGQQIYTLNLADRPVLDSILLPGHLIQTLAVTSGRILAGANDGLYSFHNKLWTSIFSTQGFEITALHIQKDQTWWVGTRQHGLKLIHLATDQILASYQHNPYESSSLSGDQILNIFTDATEQIWVSVWGKGIDFANPKQFRFRHLISHQQAAQLGIDNFIRSVVPLSNGNIWCATQQPGILCFDSQLRFQEVIHPANLRASVEHMIRTRDQFIWMATTEGVFRMNPQNRKLEKLRLPAEKTGVNHLLELKDGRILASANQGIYLFDAAGRARPLRGTDPSTVYLTSYESANGDLYISGALKGFEIVQLNDDSLIHVKSFPGRRTIKCFAQNSLGLLWIGTTEGLIGFDPDSRQIKQVISTGNGLSNQYIYGILNYGNELWLSTNGGISRVNFKPELQITNFGINDGLQSVEFNTYAYCRMQNGDFIFGGVNGLNVFNPEEVHSNFQTAPIQAIQLEVNDSTGHASPNPSEIQSLDLPYSENTFSIRLSLLDYFKTGNCVIRYKLTGFDRGWIEVPDRSIIRYGNLPPGNYQLEALVLRNGQVVSKAPYLLKITIQTPWYKSAYFYVFLVFFILGILYLIMRAHYQRTLQKELIRRDKEKAIEKERTRIATDMHDDFGANLSRIKFLSEKLQMNRTNQTGAAQEADLQKISRYSDEMAEKMGEIVWALNQRYDSLQDLISFSRSHASEYLQDKNIQLHFSSQVSGNPWINGETRRNIYLTIKEALNNTCKHAHATEVHIAFTMPDQELEVLIADNGTGFRPEQVRPFANGLVNMRKRIEDIGGTLEIDPDGPGTRLRIRMVIYPASNQE